MEILIVQRFYYNFREGFLDYLYTKEQFRLINCINSRGRVIVPGNASKKKYFTKLFSFFIGENFVIFPLLFFSLLKLRPNLVITEGGQNTINNLQIWLYCKLFRKNYIQWDLGRGYKEFESSFARKVYMSMYRKVANDASLIFGYNSSSQKYFMSLGINQDKIRVLNNTVDTISIKKTIELNKLDIPTDIEYDDSKIYIIFVGALLPTKNIENLSAILRQLDPKYFLLIIGSGDNEYVNLLKQNFKGTNHIFLGHKPQSELTPYYKIASFSILPGLGGLTINQAMAFGVPVLCNKADGAELDIIKNDVNGLVYDSIPQVVNYIKTKNKSDWQEMGKKAHETLYSEFSIERMTDHFLEGIKTVQNGR